MPRIRSIHPGFFSDEELLSVSAFARLFFLGLGVEADDKGIFPWKLVTLKVNILPNDNVDIAALLSELERVDVIRRYEIDGRKFGAIRNFRKHQRPKTPNDIHPITPQIRKYVGLGGDGPEPLPNHFGNASEKSPQMEDGGGRREGEDGEEAQGSVEPLATGVRGREAPKNVKPVSPFGMFRASFPNPAGITAAETVWNEAVQAGAAPADILAGLLRWVGYWAKRPPNNLPSASTWLQEQRWLDLETTADTDNAKAAWDGPPEIRKAVVAEKNEGFAASYLDTSHWAAEAETILAGTKFRAGRLADLECLKPYHISAEEARAA